MFNFHDVEQNTDEWMALRCGKLTSSNLKTVMANYGKAFSDTAKKLAVSIATQQITGKQDQSGFSNSHTERGHEQEPIARRLYEECFFCDVQDGGFFSSDFLGCSPDGLVCDDGLIEIKSVLGYAHFQNVKRGAVDPAYKWQNVGNVKFTGRKWIDFISYSADYPDDKQLFVCRRYAKDMKEEFEQIDIRVKAFKSLVDDCKAKINNGDYVVGC